MQREFDVEGFARAVECALISGVASQLDRVLKSALSDPELIRPSRVWLILTQTCLKMGRIRQARPWLERLVENIHQDEVFDAIGVALGCGQAELALRLYAALSPAELPGPEQCLELAAETIVLARRMRLPMKRHGVWAAHELLLKAASSMLESLLDRATLTPVQRTDIRACLAHAAKLLGNERVVIQKGARGAGSRRST